MIHRVLKRIGQSFARHRRHGLVGKIDRALLTVHKGYENLNYDMAANGELFVAKALAGAGPVSTVFDVGANHGEWSSVALDTFPAARIHAFEIVPETFGHLRGAVGAKPNMILNNVGLSDSSGVIDVHFSPDHDGLATCVPGFVEAFHHAQLETLQVTVTTGDEYCAVNRIEAIDLLKIDVEGFEPQVLRGFADMLERGRIDAIQFEYGYINIDTHFLLKDFYDFFARFGMSIGKIYPDHVDFRSYRHVDEDFYGPNYLAVRSARGDLLRVLGGRH